jgi:hypothetical protein
MSTPKKPYDCNKNIIGSNGYIPIRKGICEGETDFMGDPIENPYCVEKYCMSEQDIQRQRLLYMDPETQSPLFFHKNPRQAGDFLNPFSNKVISRHDIVKAGIGDPTENIYDEDFPRYIKKYKEGSTRYKKYATTKIRRMIKQAIKSKSRKSRPLTPESYYKNLLDVSPQDLYNNKQLPSDASYMRMLQNASPEKSPLYERSIHLSPSKTPTPKRIHRNAVDNVLRRGTAFGGTRKIK